MHNKGEMMRLGLLRFTVIATVLVFAESAPMSTCADQLNCIEIFTTLMAKSVCASNCEFEICIALKFGESCIKESNDTISHSCVKGNLVRTTSTDFGGLAAMSAGHGFKQCQTIEPGSVAQFLLKDGSGCGSGTAAVGIGDVRNATCSGRQSSIQSCTGNGVNVECMWTVNAPSNCSPMSIAFHVSPTLVPSTLPLTSNSPEVIHLTPSSFPSTVRSLSPLYAPSTQQSVSSSYSASQSQAPPFSTSTTEPSLSLSAAPSVGSSLPHSVEPSAEPSLSPSAAPSVGSSLPHSVEPSAEPSLSPSVAPSVGSSLPPSIEPRAEPSLSPSAAPSGEQSLMPSSKFISEPVLQPSVKPVNDASNQPTLAGIPKTTVTPTNVVESTPQPSWSFLQNWKESGGAQTIQAPIPTICCMVLLSSLVLII